MQPNSSFRTFFYIRRGRSRITVPYIIHISLSKTDPGPLRPDGVPGLPPAVRLQEPVGPLHLQDLPAPPARPHAPRADRHDELRLLHRGHELRALRQDLPPLPAQERHLHHQEELQVESLMFVFLLFCTV